MLSSLDSRIWYGYALSARLFAFPFGLRTPKRSSSLAKLMLSSLDSRIWYGYALSARLFAFPFGLRTPKRSSSLAKLMLSSLDSRIPFRRLMQIRLKRRSQQIELDLLHLKIGQRPSINLLYQHLLKMVCG